MENYLKSRKSYDTCKEEIIGDTMREFKKHKLKMRNNKSIIDKKQAIAVALSMVSSQCHYNKKDAELLIEKVNRDLSNKDKDIILSNIIETKDAIMYLMKHKKVKKANSLKKLLWDKIINNQNNRKKLTKHMWNEIMKINNI